MATHQTRQAASLAPSWLGMVWLVALPAISLGAPHTAGAQALSHPIVQTEGGAVQGTAFSDHQEFLGIPFAAPPVGNLRFAPPVRPAKWSGALQTQQFRSSCPQQPGFFGNIPSTDEDCLYLNVYTPPNVTVPDRRKAHNEEGQVDREQDDEGKLLPVMVWIHGGAFIYGGAASYIGTQLAANGNIIFVSIQYRLNAFGFLASTALSDASRRGLSGNYGFEDQQAAIAWVVRNISAFGGNPWRITIAGESAGAASVTNHLVSPFTARFEGAIGESTIGIGLIGLLAHDPTLSEAEATGDQFVAAVGCNTASDVMACLRSLPVATLLNASTPFVWSPIVDGFDIPLEPNTAIRKGFFRRVPILNGTNLTEGQLFALLLLLQTGRFPDAAGYAAFITQQFGSAASAILAEYPASNFSSPLEAYAMVLTDSEFSCPASSAVRAISKHSVPVYQYEFNEPNAAPSAMFFPIPGFPWIDPHAVELPYVFGGVLPAQILGAGFAPFDQTPARLALSDQLIAYWTQFVKTGTPNRSGEPFWPRYRSSRDDVQALNDSTGPEFNFRTQHHCDFWDALN